LTPESILEDLVRESGATPTRCTYLYFFKI
jgi:hypothetical protein